MNKYQTPTGREMKRKEKGCEIIVGIKPESGEDVSFFCKS